MFSYYRNEFDKHLLIVPVGKLKEKDKPWARDSKDPKKIVPVGAELYDINSLVYYDSLKIMMYTTNNSGPRVEGLVKYLNTFFCSEDGYTISISPILFNTGIEKLRRANQVRKITFKLDLQDNLENFYSGRVQNERANLYSTMRGFIGASKDELDGKSLSFTISMGQKGGTLDKEAILDLLAYINIDSAYVKEVEFSYKDGPSETVELAKIKKATYKLSASFKGDFKQLSPELLKNKAIEVFLQKRDQYTLEVDKYYEEHSQDDDDSYKVNEEWREAE